MTGVNMAPLGMLQISPDTVKVQEAQKNISKAFQEEIYTNLVDSINQEMLDIKTPAHQKDIDTLTHELLIDKDIDLKKKEILFHTSGYKITIMDSTIVCSDEKLGIKAQITVGRPRLKGVDGIRGFARGFIRKKIKNKLVDMKEQELQDSLGVNNVRIDKEELITIEEKSKTFTGYICQGLPLNSVGDIFYVSPDTVGIVWSKDTIEVPKYVVEEILEHVIQASIGKTGEYKIQLSLKDLQPAIAYIEKEKMPGITGLVKEKFKDIELTIKNLTN